MKLVKQKPLIGLVDAFALALILFFVGGFIYSMFQEHSHMKEEKKQEQAEKDFLEKRRTESAKIRKELIEEKRKASKPSSPARFQKGDLLTVKSSERRGQVVKAFFVPDDGIPEWVYLVRFLPEDKIVEVRDFEILNDK